ncbi:MAG: type II secretion system F family protein [Candidatus Bathyarchaeia archaeon]
MKKPRLSQLLRTLSEDLKLSLKKPHVFAYQMLNERTARFLPLFKDMDKNLRKSEIKINFKAYANLTIFASFLLAVLTFTIIMPTAFLIFHVRLIPSLLFGIGASMFAGAFTTLGFYLYPIYRADSLRRSLEDELPFVAGYMTILAGADVPPNAIFRSLAQVETSLGFSIEAKSITQDVELFGYDLISALEKASARTPSEKFKELLEGFIATVRSGGNLVSYLTDRSHYYRELKRISLRRFADTLSVLAEFYVALLVAGPLLFVVMLGVMAMLGGGGYGLLNPVLLLNLLTYIAIPVGSLVFLIILDIFSPRW